MPTAYILVGVPGAGKSTWIRNQHFDWNNTVIASTDNYIEQVAKSLGKTYSEVFKDNMPDAVSNMATTVVNAIAENKDIVWDQTSTTIGTRAKKLRMIPPRYKTVAVVFPTPNQKELTKRLNSRPGKTIPPNVVQDMIDKLEYPTVNEGFDEVIVVS